MAHSELPRLVKQRYGTELCSRTLASIKPEISQALDSLLEELHHSEEARVMRSAGRFQSQRPSSQFTPRRSSKAICPICKQASRKSYNHFLSNCPFLPESDQRFLTRARLIAAIEEEDQFISDQQVTDAAVGLQILTYLPLHVALKFTTNLKHLSPDVLRLIPLLSYQ